MIQTSFLIISVWAKIHLLITYEITKIDKIKKQDIIYNVHTTWRNASSDYKGSYLPTCIRKIRFFCSSETQKGNTKFTLISSLFHDGTELNSYWYSGITIRKSLRKLFLMVFHLNDFVDVLTFFPNSNEIFEKTICTWNMHI